MSELENISKNSYKLKRIKKKKYTGKNTRVSKSCGKTTKAVVSLFTLFAEPRVVKSWEGKLEENLSSIATTDMFILSALAQQQKGFLRWGFYRFLEKKCGLWASECILMCMSNSISDLSCYVTMQSHCLQDVGWGQEDIGLESPTDTILIGAISPQLCKRNTRKKKNGWSN